MYKILAFNNQIRRGEVGFRNTYESSMRGLITVHTIPTILYNRILLQKIYAVWE